MSSESDGEHGTEGETRGGGGSPLPAGTSKPRTPSAAAPDDGEPPPRYSATQLDPGPLNYPDDGPVAGGLRKIDHVTGMVEQVALFAMLAVIVLVAAVQALATKLVGHSFLWSFDVVRAGTFAIAMLGAAFASHHLSHLSMDIVSRWTSPRTRLATRVVLGLFTIFASYLLVQSGLHLRTQVASEGGNHTVPMDLVASMIPAGGGLIIFHTLLRVLIDIDYLRRGKTAPEKAPSGH